MNIDIIVIACSTLNVPKLIHKQVYKVSCLFIRFSFNVVSGKWIINLHNWLMKKKSIVILKHKQHFLYQDNLYLKYG